MTQQLVLDPLGIVTEPNKLGQIPAGALESCSQTVIRSPGVIENNKGWVQHGTSISSTQVPFHICLPNKWILIFRHDGVSWVYTWYDADTATHPYGSQALQWEDGVASIRTTSQPRFSHVIVGNQLFVQFRSQLLVWDTVNPTTLAESKPRHAGMIAPKLVLLGNGGSNGVALPPGKYCAYTAIFKRKLPGGDRTIVSAPGAATSYGNLFDASTVNVSMTFVLSTVPQVKAGDIIEVYRTKSKPVNLTIAYTTVQPSEEIGSEYLRCGSVVVTQAMINAGSFSYTDTCPDSNLGEALYTNQSVGTVADTADPPPASDFIAAYKGYVFGFGPTYSPRVRLRVTGLYGARTAVSGNNLPAATSVGSYDVTGFSWTTGATFFTLASSVEAAKVFQGMRVYLTFSVSVVVTSVVGLQVNVDTALPTGLSNQTLTCQDVLVVALGNQTRRISCATWYDTAYSLSLNAYAAFALALKLPSVGQTYYEGPNAQPVDGFELRAHYLYDDRPVLSVYGSKPLAWDPRLDPATALVVTEEYKPQQISWSNLNEPEAWPVLNQDFFARGAPHGVAVTADSIIAAYSDGIWRISGTGGSTSEGFDWRYDQIATGITVRGSQCMCVLLDRVYALTSEGLVVIDGDRVARISYGRIHDQLDVPGFKDVAYTTTSAVWICADEENNEIVFRTPETGNVIWIYNTNTDRFTKIGSHDFPVYASYSPYLRSVVYLGLTAGNWTLLAPTSASRNNMNVQFARVYADNPFVQRHWQSVSLSADVTGGSAVVTPNFNGLDGAPRTLDSSGRATFEVPRNAPAIGNTMQVGFSVSTTAKVALHGFALTYRDQTERNKNR